MNFEFRISNLGFPWKLGFEFFSLTRTRLRIHPRSLLSGFTLLVFTTSLLATAFTATADPIDIASRRELFVDDHLIEKLTGEARLELRHPQPREIVLVHDEPWEGTGSGYHSVFKDGDLYRMYYKAWHIDTSKGKLDTSRHPLYCCYAESDDGIHWRKPALGLHEFEGSKENNITITSGTVGELDVDAGHPAVFKDANPSAPAGARSNSAGSTSAS